MKHLFMGLSLLLFLSCSNEKKGQAPQAETNVKSSRQHTIHEPAEPVVADTTADGITAFHKGDFLLKVLTEAETFHEDEVWPGAEKEDWFGLYKNGDKFYVARTRVVTRRVPDIIMDEDESKPSGWEVKTNNKDTSLILFAGLPGFREGKVDHVPLKEPFILPGKSIRLMLQGKEYVLYATGKKDPESEEHYGVSDYRLYLRQGNTIQLLIAQARFEDSMMPVLFAGDIDGDGGLDLIIDTSWHYNMVRPTLYLSKPAEKGKLLKIAGWHEAVGC
jgi:hypothetical protein